MVNLPSAVLNPQNELAGFFKQNFLKKKKDNHHQLYGTLNGNRCKNSGPGGDVLDHDFL
jgi:hypothetical protein